MISDLFYKKALTPIFIWNGPTNLTILFATLSNASVAIKVLFIVKKAMKLN